MGELEATATFGILVSAASRARSRGLDVECLKRVGRGSPEGSDQGAIVGVVDLAGAMVELELLQRRKRSIPRVDQLEPASFVIGRGVEIVIEAA